MGNECKVRVKPINPHDWEGFIRFDRIAQVVLSIPIASLIAVALAIPDFRRCRKCGKIEELTPHND